MTPGAGPAAGDRKDERFGESCARASRAAAALAFLAGALNLFFRLFDPGAIRWFSPHGVVMTRGTALAFVLSGVSLWLGGSKDGRRPARLAADGCALLVALAGSLALAGHVAGRDLGWEMPPNSALIFSLLGASMLLERRRIGGAAPSLMTIAAGLAGVLGIMGYAFDAEPLIHIGPYKRMAFQTAMACVVLAAGVLLSMKDGWPIGFLSLDRAGSVMARRLLPAVVFLPVLFGLIRHWGAHAGYFREGVGVTLMVLLSVIALVVLVYRSAVLLNRSDRERERADRHRERQEKVLEETAVLLDRVFSNVHMKVAYMDSRFNFLRVNQAYADAGGYPPGHYIGRNHFDLYPHDENEKIFRRVVETGEPFFAFSRSFEYPEQPERGTTFWDWSLNPVKESDGTVAGLVLSLVDVTERVRAERLLREQEEAAIRQERVIVLGQMAAGIAHEVRNPLSGLNICLAAAENAYAEAGAPDPETLETAARAIASAREASEKIGAVIRRVMDFVRPGPVVMKRVDVNEAARDALALVSPVLRRKGIRIDTALAAGALPCRADLRLLEQLVLNLVDNAAQAAAARTGGEHRVEVSSRREGESVLIAVADSGPGVPESIRDKVFDPFFTTRPEGTGIGLAISRRIVAEHGGSIGIGTSRFGGAEFRVLLPAAAGEDIREGEEKGA